MYIFISVMFNVSIGRDISILHEWTDGCSTQYKSRHCMGDVAHSSADYGYVMIRNYFETSHVKGPQDGAGANLKHKADMAVIKRQVMLLSLAFICQIQGMCIGIDKKWKHQLVTHNKKAKL